MSDYLSEINEFKKNFKDYKNKRIVLYGIGRMTATLINGITDYNIVAVMDRDAQKVGTYIYGKPIISLDEAERISDLIIINTSEVYWDIIYNRIENTALPVYYINGKRAEKSEKRIKTSDYWNIRQDDLKKIIEDTDIVGVDFYDTLYKRRIITPSDVFTLVEIGMEKKYGVKTDYVFYRNEARSYMDKYYSINDIYDKMAELAGWSNELKNNIFEYELELERRLVYVDKQLYKLISSVNNNNNIYIVSDMYLPSYFYNDIVKRDGVNIISENILVSNELKSEKCDGGLWRQLKTKIREGKVLCIGDNEENDIINSKKEGFDSFFIPNDIDLLRNSSISDIYEKIDTLESSAIMGLIKEKLLSDRLALCENNGLVVISTPEIMGYCIFGPLLLTFYKWLLKEAETDKVSRLIFVTRDEYFLRQDFELYCNLIDKKVRIDSIAISRQLAAVGTIKNDVDLENYIKLPFSGKISELLENRFCIKNCRKYDDKELEDFIKEIRETAFFRDELWGYVRRVQDNYKNYLSSFDLCDDDALVDPSYRGSNQNYINIINNIRMRGYYFVADCSEDNRNAKEYVMKGCFQEKDDLKALKSAVFDKILYIESFLTAPYGMITEVDSEGVYKCLSGGKNQEYFDIRERINIGIKEYISCYISYFEEFDLNEDIRFVNEWIRICLSGNIVYSDSIKNSFYNENSFFHQFESPLF